MTGAPDHASRRRRPAAVTRRILHVAVRIPYVVLMAPAAVGGQAVMDGVMMRGPGSWAVAVRRHDGTIAVQHRQHRSFGARHRWARIPLVRGVAALIESLIIGMKALFVSSEYAIEGVEAKYAEVDAARAVGGGDAAGSVGDAPHVRSSQEQHELHDVERAATMSGSTGALGAPIPLPHNEEAPAPDPDALSTIAIVVAMVVAMAFSIGLFKIVPVTIVTLLPIDRDAWAFVLVEALVKFALFCGYLLGIGLMPDMRRVFEYHSAEHKAINAWERAVPLEPEQVNAMSRIHVRCGTAFIVWLFVIGMLVFRVAQLTYLQGAGRLEIIATRPLLLPIIAGLSFEILRFAGQHADSGFLRGVLAPGLWFQRLTTRECTPAQCEVAIASLEAVLVREGMVPGAPEDVSPTPADEAAEDYEILT